MKNLTFLENIGNASTSASLNGKRIGYNVNASAYTKSDGTITVYLESNMSIVHGVKSKSFKDVEDFEEWKDDISENRALFAAAIEEFGATVSI